MKTKTMFCALSLLAAALACQAQAEARNYLPYKTTAVRLADNAQVIVSGRLERVESVLTGAGNRDAAVHKRIDNGAWQDGEDGVRREGVLRVNEVLKGSGIAAGGELRFVSMRQLQLAAYDADLRDGDAVYFLSARPEDSRLAVLNDERGAISGPDIGGGINTVVDFVRGYLETGRAGSLDRMLDAIDLNGGRLSVDACIELSWNHEDYTAAMTEERKQRLLSLARLSRPATAERNELITAVGRHQPEGAFEALVEIMLGDASWSTTSLASLALETLDRQAIITRLLDEWQGTDNDATRMVIVRSLGLIRPKADHDGAELRTRTLNLVGSLLVASTGKDLLREAMIASRDLRAEDAHMAALKKLLDERETNGLADAEVKGAVIALAAARKIAPSGSGPDGEAVLARQYLLDLAKADPVLKQVVESSLTFPYTTLIVGADGLGH